MTLLTSTEIKAKNIVKENCPHGSVGKSKSWRTTTYDATVGSILTKKGKCETSSYSLPPRGIAWVISREEFKMPKDVTGISTLRTTWTHRGILTLTVGIVDPEYIGHLSTAVINFGSAPFYISKGDPFFRTAFFSHGDDQTFPREDGVEEYHNNVLQSTASFSENFLSIDTLTDEIVPKILNVPKLGLWITLAGLSLAILGLILPALGQRTFVEKKLTEKIEAIETRLDSLEKSP